MKEAKYRLPDFQFNYEYINAKLTDALFIDVKKQVVGFYEHKRTKKFGSTYVGIDSVSQKIPFGQIQEIGIQDNTFEIISLLSDFELNFLANHENMAELLQKYKEKSRLMCSI
ncbi:hypothetical protein SOP94_17160 [Peribacillus frigoritolerans]|nr:hypothetical protein [Peribacillus frigoritolerans]